MQLTREIILVCGVTGTGKTTWARHFTKMLRRFLCYDIAASFPVQYVEGSHLAHTVREQGLPPEFRIGVYSPYDTDILTAASYVVGNCWLMLEEISTIYKIGARIDGPLQEVTLLGRHRRVNVIAIAQRLSYVPITLRSQASRIISYRQQEPADVKSLAEVIGREKAQEVLALPDFECMDWHKGVIQRYAVPDFTDTHAHTQTDDTPNGNTHDP